jgi:hypothetical protein
MAVGRTLKRFALASLLSSISFAGMITGTSWAPAGDNPLDITFTLTHGPITANAIHNPGIMNSPLNFWQLTITSIEETNTTFNPGDAVKIVGTFQHTVNPPGHSDGALGVLFPFELTATKAAPKVNVLGNRSHPAKTHRDAYSISILASYTGNNITGYTFTATGSHIPEPGSCLLLGGGLCALGIWRGWRMNLLR